MGQKPSLQMPSIVQEETNMRFKNQVGKAWLSLAVAVLVGAGASTSWGAAAQNSKGEAKCQEQVTKTMSKHAAAVAKAMSACTNSLIAGDVGSCPDAKAQAAIDKSAAKSLKVAKKCQSLCSISEVPCIGSSTCPPAGQLSESCAGKGNFEFSAMGFPGPFCNNLIGHNMVDPEDFGECSVGIGDIVANVIMDNVYGTLNAPVSSDASKCLASIVKSAPKSAGKMASSVAKCRTSLLTSETPAILPNDCATADAKTSANVDKTRQKFLEGIAKECTDATVSELDLCGAGVGGTTTVVAAQDCLGQMLDEVSISNDNGDSRSYAEIGIINGSYPATSVARCGDNLINQLPDQFLLNGEECDGDDDDACPGLCLPEGDTFECTCSNIPRGRAFADGFGADLDNGWSGSSHNSKVTDGAGFVAEVSDCDCDEFDPVNTSDCIGNTSDQVCTLYAELFPRCSQRIGDGTSCDQVGQTDGINADSDCAACDEFSTNAGDYCTGSARYCVGGVSTGDACNVPADCPGGSCSGSGRCMAPSPFAGNGCTGNQNCGVCVGGSNAGGTCSLPGDCPGGSCTAYNCTNKVCSGGADNGEPCLTNATCDAGNCTAITDCGSQCYDENDVASGPCNFQSECPDGERCRGICDTTNYCLKISNGAPLPLSAEGTSVCVNSQFHTAVNGTKDMVTGAHAVNYELRSIVSLANSINSRPCPVCGGYCGEGTKAGWRCDGSCSGPALECRNGVNIGDTCTTNADCDGQVCDAVRCRFDDDCGVGETCDGAASPECRGDTCRLDLSCAGGPNNGQACRVEAYTAYGTTSSECPTDLGSNVSGTGLAIVWNPLTSGTVSLVQPGACDAPGFENYDCNCVIGGGNTRNQPNKCAPACSNPTDPSDFGRTCAAFTVCEGGSEPGAACDETSDCSGGGTCTGNPRVCGDGNAGVCSGKFCSGGGNDGGSCATGAQCPGGTCVPPPCTIGGAPCVAGACIPDNCSTNADCEAAVVCEDVCPGGLCTPLCTELGSCTGGSNPGANCALDIDCLGGGTCDNQDPEEGACAQGVFSHCDGPGWEFISCNVLQIGTQQGCEMGNNLVLGDANDNIGAGYCIADIKKCFVNDGEATGGTTANGYSPTNTRSVAAYCIPASTNGAVNSTSGLPGPGRIRQDAVSITNYTSLP